MICDEFSHPREIETTLDHTECSVYPPVTRNDGVMMGRDDILDTVLRDNDFIVCTQSPVIEVLTLVVFELPCCWVEEIREHLVVMSVVLHPIVENGVCQGNETSNNVGD